MVASGGPFCIPSRDLYLYLSKCLSGSLEREQEWNKDLLSPLSLLQVSYVNECNQLQPYGKAEFA